MRNRRWSLAEQSFTQEIYDYDLYTIKNIQKNELCASFMIFWEKNLLIFFFMALCRLRPLYLLSVKEPTTKKNILKFKTAIDDGNPQESYVNLINGTHTHFSEIPSKKISNQSF